MVGESRNGGPMRSCWFAGLGTLLIGCGGAPDPVQAFAGSMYSQRQRSRASAARAAA